MLVLGVDPGKKGALAIYDSNTRAIVMCADLPTNGRQGSARQYDKYEMGECFKKIPPVDFAVLEEMEERPVFVKGKMQPRTGMLALGTGWGYVDMLLFVNNFRTHYVRPSQWKPKMKCGTDSVFRADQLFPEHRAMFRGVRGGALDGRADAAMIALYGATYVMQ
jgi:hypothetical protein